jgi:hypothetical protein
MSIPNTAADAVPSSNITGKEVEETIATEPSIEDGKFGSNEFPTETEQAKDEANRAEAPAHKEEPTFPPPEASQFKARSPSLIPTISTRKSPSIKSGISPAPSISSLASLSIYYSLEDSPHGFHIPPETELAPFPLPQLPKISPITETEPENTPPRRPLSQRVKSLVAGIFHDSIAFPKKVRKIVAEQEREMQAKYHALYSHHADSMRPHRESFSHSGLPKRMRMKMQSTLSIHGEETEDSYGGGSNRRG